MVKLEELKKLEKRASVELRYCEIVADTTDEAENERTRVLKDGDRYFYHKMRGGEIVECFELALSWKPFDGVLVFAYTPDDRHEYQIDVRRGDGSVFRIGSPDVVPLGSDVVELGDRCEYGGHTVEIVTEDAIKFDGRTLPVVSDSEYTYKLQNRQIRAQGGARGLFRFLDGIAEEGKLRRLPLFHQVYETMAKKYAGG